MTFNTIGKLIISAVYLVSFGVLGFIGYSIDANQNRLMVKSVTTRDVNKDGLDDIVITHRDNSNEAYIKQKDGSYISWNQIRDKIYSSIREPIDSEINKGAQ